VTGGTGHGLKSDRIACEAHSTKSGSTRNDAVSDPFFPRATVAILWPDQPFIPVIHQHSTVLRTDTGRDKSPASAAQMLEQRFPKELR
jgi:hypothetical protein